MDFKQHSAEYTEQMTKIRKLINKGVRKFIVKHSIDNTPSSYAHYNEFVVLHNDDGSNMPYFRSLETGRVFVLSLVRLESANQQFSDLHAANEYIKELQEGLELVRKIICDAAFVGFNYQYGTWTEDLFRSQAITYELLNKHKRM